jgi:hypothetical protein
MNTFSSFSQLAAYSAQQSCTVPDVQILNANGDIHVDFKRLYETLPANSPAKRRLLLNLLNQYRSLSQSEKAAFDKFLISCSGIQQ